MRYTDFMFPGRSPKKILAIKLRALGDTVIFAAAVEELVKAFPGAELHLLVTNPWAGVFKGDPRITRIWTVGRRGIFRKTALGLKLWRQKFDLVLNFHASSSSAWLARATGAPVRAIHFHGLRDKNNFSTVEIPGKGVVKPIIERDLDVVRALGIPLPAGRLPRLHVSNGEIGEGRRLIGSFDLAKPVLVLGLGASRATKIWPLARYAELAMMWRERTGGGVLAIGSSEEESLCKEFLANIPEAGRDGIKIETSLTLRSLMGLLSCASVFCGNDSGPRHLAASLGTPTCTLFGPEDPFEWHPYPLDLHPRFFVENLPCRKDGTPGFPAWCGAEACTEKTHACMDIDVNAVFEACRKIGRSPG